MNNEKYPWDSFQKLTVDRKRIERSIKRAETVTMRHTRKFISMRLDSIRDAQVPIIGWLFTVGLILAGITVQTVLYSKNYSITAAEVGGTYSEGMLGPINTLNPLYATTNAESSVARLVFSSLYSYDGTGHLTNDLAESIATDPTGRFYTVRLRNNAQWHDGKALTAQDVAFTISLIKNPVVRSPLRVNWRDVNVRAVDDTTIVFELPAMYAAFQHALTFPVLPKHILGTIPPAAVRENAFGNTPLGSGPFKFKLLQLVDTIRNHKVIHLVANDAYYKGQPKLSRFEVYAYQNQNDIVKALTAGTDITLADGLAVRGDSYNIRQVPVNSGEYLILNMSNPVLSDAAVRRALAMATDTKSIQQLVGTNVPALSLPFVNGQLTGNLPSSHPYDLARANATLDAAGWIIDGTGRKKGEQPLALKITTTNDAQVVLVARKVADQWKRLNIDVQLNIIDTTQPNSNFVQTILQPRNYDVLLYELQIGADPDVYAYWHSSQIGMNGYNFSNYSDKTVDATLVSARSRLEADLRNAKYLTFAAQWLSDVPAIGLYQQTITYASNIRAHSVYDGQSAVTKSDRYSNVLYWSVESRSIYKTP